MSDIHAPVKETASASSVVRYSDYLRVAKYAAYIKKDLLLRVLLGLAATGSYALQAVLLARGIDSVFAGAAFGRAASFFLAAAACILFRSFLLRYTEGYSKSVGGKIKAILRELVIAKLMELGPGYQSDKRSGRFQSLVTDGVEYIEPYLVQYIPQVFIVLFSVVPMIGYIFSRSAAAGGIVAASVLLALLMPHIFMRFYTRANMEYWREYAALNAQYIDTMQGMNTVKLFNAEEYKGRQLREVSERFRIRQLTNTRNSLFSNGNVALMTGIATSVAAGVAAYQTAAGLMPLAALLTILFLAMECLRPIGDLNNAWHSSMMGFSVASEILEILGEKVPTKEKPDAKAEGLDSELPEISFRNVSFRYRDDREQVFEDFSLDIRPGETVAIVGQSGAGKSTLVNLLLRFYDVQGGSVQIGGSDIRDYDLEYLRGKIAVVFQNTYLFYGSVRDNLRMAAPEATEEELIAAARAANAHDFIQALPQGYDTLVGERGETLSGGQRQRIAIARAILKHAPILLLDEATSSVDAASEQLIQSTIEGLQGQFTTVIIAHRLSTIQNAQRIFVLEKGRVVECGTHSQLLARDGAYKRLIEAQKGGEGLA